MKEQIKHSSTSNLHRLKIIDTTDNLGLTGLTYASSGLKISTICDNEATATVYTSAASNVEDITVLGTYAAPTAGKCRFKEVDATNHPGVYEIHLANARYAVAGAKKLVITISGATNADECDLELELVAYDPQDAVSLGLSRIDAAITSRMATFTLPTNFAALGIEVGGELSSLNGHTPQTADHAANLTTLIGRLTAARAGYLDNLNVGGLLASQADITTITQAQRVQIGLYPFLERPDAGSVDYRVWIYVYDEQHLAEDLDSNPTVTVETNDGTDRSANLSIVSHPATGIYYVDYTVDNAHTVEGLVFKVAATEGALTTNYARSTIVVDTTAVDYTSTDRTRDDAISTAITALATAVAALSTGAGVKLGNFIHGGSAATLELGSNSATDPAFKIAQTGTYHAVQITASGTDADGVNIGGGGTTAMGMPGAGIRFSGPTSNHVIAGSEVLSFIGNHLNYLFESAYDPSAKPGNAAGLLNVLVQDNGGGVPQYTADSLSLAPSGGAGGDASEANQLTIIDMLVEMQGLGFDTNLHSLVAIKNALPSAGDTGAWTIVITITDGTDPLENARVRVTNGAESYLKVTDVDGKVTFHLDTKTWAIAVTLPPYELATQSLVVSADDATTVYAMTLASWLPVAAGSYCIRDQVEMHYGASNVARWADLDNDEDATKISNRITWAIAFAGLDIETNLRAGAFSLPFDDVPDTPGFIQELAAVKAGLILYSSRGEADTDGGEDRYTRKDKWYCATIHALLVAARRLPGLDDATISHTPKVIK